MNRFNPMKKYAIINILSFILFIAIAYFSIKIFTLEQKKKFYKEDIIELSLAKYGIFNVDVWRDKIAVVVTNKVNKFKLTENNKIKLRVKVERLLREVVYELKEDTKRRNRRESLFGIIDYKNFIADITGVFDQLDDNIPKITEQIINFLDNKDNKEKIKHYILNQLDKYRKETFSETDYSNINALKRKYATSDIKDTKQKVRMIIHYIDKKLRKQEYIISFLIFLFFIFLIFYTGKNKILFLEFVLAVGVLLFLGLSLPMINIDARITKLSFKLLGEPVLFQDQVLYYKSKSIIEVVVLMLKQADIKVFFVGILILLFSVIFPLTKLIASVMYLFNRNIRNKKLVKLLVFDIGKWSMADVMVISIFMAYLGFNGILTEQLKQLENLGKNINIFTTNYSQLQPGYYFFISFVVLSILLSQKVKKLLKI